VSRARTAAQLAKALGQNLHHDLLYSLLILAQLVKQQVALGKSFPHHRCVRSAAEHMLHHGQSNVMLCYVFLYLFRVARVG
jgi:hypothetical protein